MRTALLALVACGAARPVAPLVVQPSPPIALDVGSSTPIVEQGDAVYVLAGKVATIVRGGAIAARIEAPAAWTAGASIAAPDGDGRWVVGADTDGKLWRLTASGEREDVSDRLGLAGAKIRAVGGAGTTTAFDLGDAIAYTIDGVHLARVPATPGSSLAVARGVLARATNGHVESWDLVHATRVTYPVHSDAIAFLDADSDHPRLVIADTDRVWIERGGQLHAIGAPGPVRAIAAARDRLWIDGGDDRLYTLDGARFVATTAPPGLLAAASQDGDAWLARPHALLRYSPGGGTVEPAWTAQVAPVFQRVCSHCHLPDGDSGIDLSTAASWHADRDELVRRVLVTRTMPPAGTDLSDADRAALAGWLNASASR
ncbi:MAG TPA: cytochrome c [Kofleriaceae bacterium]